MFFAGYWFEQKAFTIPSILCLIGFAICLFIRDRLVYDNKIKSKQGRSGYPSE